MQYRKRLIFTGILLVLAIIIKAYSANPGRAETGYATGFYPGFAANLRWLLCRLPFSVGDVLYGLFGIWVLWKLVKGITMLWKRKATWKGTGLRSLKALGLMLLLYVVFNSFWGINYNRRGIAFQLGLKMDKYTLEELQTVNALLLEKVNKTKQDLVSAGMAYPSKKVLFERAVQRYQVIDSIYPFLHYQTPSLKPSLWGWLGNYVGFLGYYNPFTGEAQVNTLVPQFLQPYTVCHEVAHQLGYAKENEANFVGYLAASASGDTLFQYSVYLDLFLYSNRNLFSSDSVSAKSYAARLLPPVKDDLKEWREFNRRHKNPVEPVIRWAYGKYLENNEQPQGVLSYDEVTSFIIAYYKKFGKI